MPSDFPLEDLHIIIQIAMGWSNSHLHQFIKNDKFYTQKMSGDDLWDELENIDYQDLTISDLLSRKGSKMDYEYDFGDGWLHEITVEAVRLDDGSTKCPICLDGKMNCPPEDCGGMGGYEFLLKVLKDPTHEEYEDMLEWVGGEFDPQFFDKEEVNKMIWGQ